MLLKKIKDKNSRFSTITEWKRSPHIVLCDSLIGCSEQCPFCEEQCKLTDSNHMMTGKKTLHRYSQTSVFRKVYMDEQ